MALYFSKERAGVADVDVQCRTITPVRALDGQGLHRGEDVEIGGCCCKKVDCGNRDPELIANSL